MRSVEQLLPPLPGRVGVQAQDRGEASLRMRIASAWVQRFWPMMIPAARLITVWELIAACRSCSASR